MQVTAHQAVMHCPFIRIHTRQAGVQTAPTEMP
jgi:hypothetical protein